MRLQQGECFLRIRVATGNREPRTKCHRTFKKRVAFPTVCSNMVHYRTGTRGSTHDSYFVLLSIEKVDFVLHPLQSEFLIVETCVWHCTRGQRKGWPTEEAKNPKTIVWRNPHDGTRGILEEGSWVSHRGLGAQGVSAAIYPVRGQLEILTAPEKSTNQNRTGTLPKSPLRTFRGTMTSRNKQSSL